jgi:gamma-F420-2:alpha-L-glutamate ligase
MKTWIVLQKRDKNVNYETDRLLVEGGEGTELIYHPNVDIIVDRQDRRSIRVKNQVVDLPNVVIPRTGSGTGYFGHSLLRHFEKLGVPLLNNSASIEVTKDKLHAAQVFAEHHLPTPKTMLVKDPVNPSLVAREIGFPCVVKIFAGSYGKGVYLCNNSREFRDFIEFAHGIKSDEAIIVQEFIKSRPGEDVRVIVVGGKALGAMKRSSKDGSFKANITRGGVGENYPLNPRIEEIAIKTTNALGLDVAGIDLLFDGDDYKLCEANSAPGFKGFEKYTGINVARAIIDYAKTKASIE